MVDATTILDFWLKAGPKAWFSKNEAFDASIDVQFGLLLNKAAANELSAWEKNPESALALILMLDQFSRNLYRDDPRAFAQDKMCLKITKAALKNKFDHKVDPALRQFFYMPLMHSESILDQRICVKLFHAINLPDNLKYAILHRDIIERFGHFPHRNVVLGRPTSPAGQAFLDAGGFSG